MRTRRPEGLLASVDMYSGREKAHKRKVFALVNVQMALGQTAGCSRLAGPKSLCVRLETQEI